MDKQLQDYYENRFAMMAMKGWTDLIDDAKKMYEAINNVIPIQTEQELHLKRGQLDVLQWLLSLKDVSEESFEQLQSGDSGNEKDL